MKNKKNFKSLPEKKGLPFFLKVIIASVAVIIIFSLIKNHFEQTKESDQRRAAQEYQRQVEEDNNKKKKEYVKLQTPIRKPIMEEWTRAGDSLALLTRDSVALEVMKFFKQNCWLTAPHPKGIVLLSGPDSVRHLIYFASFLPNDVVEDAQMRENINSEYAGALYSYGLSCIIVKNSDSLSPIAKGMFLCHETSHGREQKLTNFDSSNDSLMVDEEMRAYIMQNKIISKLGGKRYQTILDTEKKRIKELIKAEMIDLNKTFPGPGMYDENLVKVCGKPKSVFEKAMWRTLVWQQAFFQIFDEEYAENKVEKKRSFIFSLYAKLGFFEKK